MFCCSPDEEGAPPTLWIAWNALTAVPCLECVVVLTYYTINKSTRFPSSIRVPYILFFFFLYLLLLFLFFFVSLTAADRTHTLGYAWALVDQPVVRNDPQENLVVLRGINIVADVYCPMLSPVFSVRSDSPCCLRTLIPDASSVHLAPMNSEGGTRSSAESRRWRRRGLPMAALITDCGREHGAQTLGWIRRWEPMMSQGKAAV